SRCQQQYRRHRTDGVHPARPQARPRDRQSLRRWPTGVRRRVERGRLMDRELLLEIGCEEIPASWLPDLTNQVGEVVDAQLKEHRLPAEAPVETFSTPRRLTVRIFRVPERQTDLEELVNGPPVSAAFKPDGSATPAAAGFASKQGVEVSALERV